MTGFVWIQNLLHRKVQKISAGPRVPVKIPHALLTSPFWRSQVWTPSKTKTSWCHKLFIRHQREFAGLISVHLMHWKLHKNPLQKQKQRKLSHSHNPQESRISLDEKHAVSQPSRFSLYTGPPCFGLSQYFKMQQDQRTPNTDNSCPGQSRRSLQTDKNHKVKQDRIPASKHSIPTVSETERNTLHLLTGPQCRHCQHTQRG